MPRELTPEQQAVLTPENIEIVGKVLETMMQMCDGRPLTLKIKLGRENESCFGLETRRNGIEPVPDLQYVLNEFVWLALRHHV